MRCINIFLALLILLAPGLLKAAAPCAPDRILVLTDSHGLGPFGEYLDRWLVTQPSTELQTYNLGGSSPPWWFKGLSTPHGFVFNSCAGSPVPARNRVKHSRIRAPLLPALIEEGAKLYRRQIVIIEQGGNVPGTPSLYREWAAKIARVVLSHPGNICAWIAPPKMGAVSEAYSERVYQAIKAGLEDAAKEHPNDPKAVCHLIDSRPFTEYPRAGGDGYHYPYNKAGMASTRIWADEVIKFLTPLF